jgi:(p)ppGpp synthase/HD superfamily hydrolase
MIGPGTGTASFLEHVGHHPRVARAFHFAREAHRGQTRKGGGAFIFHPIRVAKTVMSVPHTIEMIEAALLHDTVEDTQVTIGQIQAEFGLTVARLVRALTCTLTPEDGNRATRKRLKRERLAKAGPEVATIKLADIIDNSRDISTLSKSFARVYLSEQKSLVEALFNADAALRSIALEVIEREQSKVELLDELAFA